MQPTGELLTRPGGLADRLKQIRKAAGLTGDQLAERLSWTRSKVPKLERGRQIPTAGDIRAWAQACGQPDTVEELLELLAEAETVYQQWQRWRRRGHAAIQDELDRLVRKGKRIRDVETFTVPGLLQTPDYARCKMQEAVRNHGFPEAGVEPAVAARMKRQEALYSSDREFEFVITEAALRFLPCPPDVMLGQLDRLASLSGLSNITLAIVPMGRPLPVTPINEFLIVDDVTYLETHTGTYTLRGEESANFARRADGLLAESVTGDEARALISAASDALR